MTYSRFAGAPLLFCITTKFYVRRGTPRVLRRQPIVCTNRVPLIHRERSPFPAGEGLGWCALLMSAYPWWLRTKVTLRQPSSAEEGGIKLTSLFVSSGDGCSSPFKRKVTLCCNTSSVLLRNPPCLACGLGHARGKTTHCVVF